MITPKPPVVASPDEWEERLLPLAYARFDARCGCCGLPLDRPHVHHRRLKSHGRIDRPDNLIALREVCHRRWHEQDREEAERRGLIVPSWADPREVPVVLWSGRRVWLDEWGNARPSPPPHDCEWETVACDDGPPVEVCGRCGLVRGEDPEAVPPVGVWTP